MYLNTDIIFSTTASICGSEITQHLGILAERSVISVSDAAELVAAMDTQYAALADAMNRRARDIGADAVVGVNFAADRLDGGLLLSITGNAVRLKETEAAEEAPEAVQQPEEEKKEEASPAVIPEEKAEEAPAEEKIEARRTCPKAEGAQKIPPVEVPQVRFQQRLAVPLLPEVRRNPPFRLEMLRLRPG